MTERIPEEEAREMRNAIEDLKERLPLIEAGVAEDVLDVILAAQRMLATWGPST